MGDASLELLGTVGCHLCEEADGVVRAACQYLRLPVKHVDIATDEALVGRYGSRIPVLRYRASNRTACELDWPFGLLDVQRLVRMRESAD